MQREPKPERPSLSPYEEEEEEEGTLRWDPHPDRHLGEESLEWDPYPNAVEAPETEQLEAGDPLVAEAQFLTSALMTRAVSGTSGPPTDIYTADVEADAAAFDHQYNVFREYSLPFPCLTDGRSDPIPLDMTPVVGSVIGVYSVRHPEDVEWSLRRLSENGDHFEERTGLWYTEPHPDEARSFFRNRLVRFLFGRIRSDTGRRAAPAPGLVFRVGTQRSGLRIHYTPAYFFTEKRTFGAPTSPVEGWIQPGLYRFGAVGPEFPLTFDPAEFEIPPLTEAWLTI